MSLRPLSPSRWNYSAAAHLLNRAGFGGTPDDVEKLHALGHVKAVESLVNFESIPDTTPNPDWPRPSPERFEMYRQMRNAPADKKQEMRRREQREQRQQISELRYWWLQRMVSGRRPLQEKLALFWHGHFATSAQKVRNAYLMWRQNDIFRRHGSGHWLTLLTEVSKDPAMLLWLDQAQSRRQHPNENFAREVMELFTLGEGNYGEKDITEAARAFTGWSFNRIDQEFAWNPRWHDPGVKTVVGKTGNFKGEDVLRIIVEQPQAARFIARKLWIFFASENPPSELVEMLAAGFRSSGSHFKPLLRAMFMSELFYSPEAMRQQVKSPVQWLVSSVRALERELPPAPLSSNMLRQLGQDLLFPPNVKGWDGGLSWITTNNLLNRYNYAAYLVVGQDLLNPRQRPRGRSSRNTSGNSPVEVGRLFGEEVRKNRKLLASAIQKRLLHAELKPEHQSAVRAYLDSQGVLDDLDVLHAIRLVMCTPEFQLT